MGEQIFDSGLNEKQLTTLCNALVVYEEIMESQETTKEVQEIIEIISKMTI